MGWSPKSKSCLPIWMKFTGKKLYGYTNWCAKFQRLASTSFWEMASIDWNWPHNEALAMDFWKIFTFNELSFLNHLTNWAGIKFGSLIRICTFRFNKFHTYLRPFLKKSAPEAMSKGQNRVIDRFFHLKLAAISEPVHQFSWNKFLFSCLSLHFQIIRAHARTNSFRQRKWPITDQKIT